MNLVMKDLTTMVTTVGNGYLNLMKRGAKGFSTPGRQQSYDGTDTLVGTMSDDERRAR